MSTRVLIVGAATTAWDGLAEPEDVETHHVAGEQLAAVPYLATGYDLVVVDSGDTDRDLALCRQLRSVHDGPILLLTPTRAEPYLLQAYAAVDECIPKPVSDRLLLAKLGAWRRRLDLARTMDLM